MNKLLFVTMRVGEVTKRVRYSKAVKVLERAKLLDLDIYTWVRTVEGMRFEYYGIDTTDEVTLMFAYTE